jgi:hypothetical protein
MECTISHRAVEIEKLVDRLVNVCVIAHKVIPIDRFWAFIHKQPIEAQEYRCPIMIQLTPHVQHLVQSDLGLILLRLQIDY